MFSCQKLRKTEAREGKLRDLLPKESVFQIGLQTVLNMYVLCVCVCRYIDIVYVHTHFLKVHDTDKNTFILLY